MTAHPSSARILRVGRWLASIVFASGVALACAGKSARDEANRSGSGGDAGTAGSETGGAVGGTASLGGMVGSDGTAGMAPIPGDEAVACSKNSDCVLALKSCCRCNLSSLDQAVAVNRDYAPVYEDEVCAGVSSCPGCSDIPTPHYRAACLSGRCTAVDLFETEVTACVDAADCKFREARCCGCSESVRSSIIPIGIDQDEAFESLACDPGAACEECAVSIPEGSDFRLGCDGHCLTLGFVP